MAATFLNNNEIRIRFAGRTDKKEADFYVAHTRIPMLVDLNDASLLFFPDENDRGFGGDLIIRQQDNKANQRKPFNREASVPKVEVKDDEIDDGDDS